MPAMDDNYGRVLSPSDVSLDMPDVVQGDNVPQPPPDLGNALWIYQTQGKINGVPVAQEARGLPIDGDDMLQTVFMLDKHPRCMVLRLHDGDCSDKDKFDELLSRAYLGEVSIVSEDIQFDASRGHFLVLLKFEELQYVLHPRYSYLKNDD